MVTTREIQGLFAVGDQTEWTALSEVRHVRVQT
jgi:hypothetical protein